MHVVSERGDLAGAGHLDAQVRVGAGQTRPGELGHLDRDIVALLGHEVGGRRHVLVHDGTRRDVDKVYAKHLAHEGERATGTQVALDHLEVRFAVRVFLADDLHVERSTDVECLAHARGNVLDAGHVDVADRERREDQRGIARVHTGVLDVLRHGVHDELALVRHGIHVDLLRIGNKLGEHHRVVRVHLGGGGQVVLKRGLVPNDVHRGTRQDVARADQDRVGDAVREFLGLGDVGHLDPVGLVDADGVEDRRELVAVLGRVDLDRVGAQDVHVGILEAQRNVLRQLAAHRHHGARRALELVDVHHTLEAELLKVEAVRLVVVRRDRLRVVVDHDGLVAHVLDAAHTRHRTPVELDRGADAVHTRAEHHRTVLVKLDVVRSCVVGRVQVVGLCGVLGGDRVDALHPRVDAERLAQLAHLGLRRVGQLGDLEVGEAALLGGAQQLLVDALQRACGLQRLVRRHNVLQLEQEPAVDLGEVVQALHVVVLLEHRIGNRKQARVGRDGERVVEVLGAGVHVEAVVVRRDLAHRLLQRLFKRAADGHHFTDRLHAGARLAVDVLELGQVPLGDLGHDVVQRRLKARRGRLGHCVGQLGERVAQRELGRGVRQRVTGRLGRQGTRAAQTRVHLNHAVLAAVRAQRILDVALADDAKVPNDLERGGAEHVVVVVRECLRGRDDDRVAGVDAEWVKVFHVAADQRIVLLVAQHLVLALLPAAQTLFDQDLGAETERAGAQVAQLVLVVGEARAETTERVRRTHNHRVADLARGAQRLGHGRHGLAARDRDVDFVERLHEQVAVLAHAQHVDLRPEHLDAEPLKHAHLVELDADVECALPTKRQKHAVRALLLEDVRDVIGRDWQEVDLRRELVRRLDRGDVGVDQHRLDAALAQGLDGLRPTVVKLARLADAQTARADEQHLFDIGLGRLGQELAPSLQPLVRDGGRGRGRRGGRVVPDGGRRRSAYGARRAVYGVHRGA